MERRTGLPVPGKEVTDMFRIVNRLIQWTGKYKRRIYIGFIYAFIHSIFTAIPIMLAAKGLSAVLDDFNVSAPRNSVLAKPSLPVRKSFHGVAVYF